MDNKGKCDRCGQNEDTHIFNECEKYQYPIWQHLERILQTVYISQIIRNEGRFGESSTV